MKIRSRRSHQHVAAKISLMIQEHVNDTRRFELLGGRTVVAQANPGRKSLVDTVEAAQINFDLRQRVEAALEFSQTGELRHR